VPRISKTKTSRHEEASRLVTLRSALGMTQRELAKEFMVSPGSIALWEGGQRTIPGSVLKLMDIYDKKTKRKS
jgi:transcriptional regulator with XRE-family HTH domain